MNMVDPNKISGNLPENGNNTRTENAQIQEEDNTEIICLFCKREVRKKCPVNTNEHLLNAVASLNIEYYTIPHLIDYGCFQCVKDILLLAEQRRMIQRNILKNRANYFVRCGNKKMCAKYLAETKSISRKSFFNISSTTSQMPPGPSNLKITDVRTITRSDVDNLKESETLMNGYTKEEATTTATTIATTNAATTATGTVTAAALTTIATQTAGTVPAPTTTTTATKTRKTTKNYVPNSIEEPIGTSANNLLLDIMYEQQESVLATESGGQVDHDSTARSIFSGSNLSNSIKCQYCPRTYSRQRYLRKHEKRHLLQKIQTNLQKDRRNRSIIFKCSTCDTVLESLNSLKAHENLHKNKFKCSYCDEEFFLQIKLELHEAICLGKLGATDSNGRHQYYTRSQRTQQSTEHQSVDDEANGGGTVTTGDDDGITIATIESEPTFNARINRWLINVQDTDNLSQCAKTLDSKSVNSSSFLSSIQTRLLSGSEADTDTTESICSTIYNNKRRKIRSKDSVRSGKTGKKRKSIDAQNVQWLCPVDDCGYMDNSLDSLMTHDIECHDPLPLFYCKKCRGRFVRRFYLEQHLKYQSYGRWVCCYCEAQFEKEPDLKDHFDEHKKNDRHNCEICNLSFITDHELQKHLCTNEHFDKKKLRKCIFLERRQYSYKAEPINEDEQQCQQEQEQRSTIENTRNPSRKRYRSVIKVLKLMDEEKTDQFDFLSWSWKRGVLLPLPIDRKAQNCVGLVKPKP